MKRVNLVIIGAALIAASVAAGLANAKTLRWSSANDVSTMDPHSQNDLLTNSINGQVYEYLVDRDKQLGLAPELAESWEQVNPTTWRFKLRKGVKFHDGSPFTADDVVFSVNRAKEPTSLIRVYANAMGTPKKIDDHTVEFDTGTPNPVMLQHATTLQIMSKPWSEKNNATKPQDFKNKEQTFSAMNANGTGPYVLKSRQPDIQTVYARNPNYWRPIEGNVTEIVYKPIGNDATRMAALLSGEIDFVLDPPPQDVARLKSQPNIKIIEGPENRIVFIGFDMFRDELINANVKGKNPFKDKRVREAMYRAVDINAIESKIMRGLGKPTGGMTPSMLASNPDAEKRLPFDVAGAKKLMADAGYPNGFEVGMDCPNDRYINDEQICQALAAMWSQIGLKINLKTQRKVTYFPQLEKHETSLYMLGWGGAITDAQTIFDPVLHTRDGKGKGDYNYGRSNVPELDELIGQARVEMNAEKRKQIIASALKVHNDNVLRIPLHRQVIPWAARSNMEAIHRADNWLEVQWVKLN